MRLELTGRHVEITPALRRLVDRKLQRLERMLNDSALSAQVVLTREKRSRRADVTLHARGEKFLHGVGMSVAWEASMSQAIDKIVQQAQRVKGKWQERKRRAPKALPGTPPIGESREAAVVTPGAPVRPAGIRPRMPRILRASKQAVRAMSIGDAAREIEANGEGVVVFRDAETAALSVLVRRANGELTLVETEA
jgi:putative sigma-54 modulation protein